MLTEYYVLSCISNRNCSSAQTAAKADINTVNVVVKHVPDFSASREKVREMLAKYVWNGFEAVLVQQIIICLHLLPTCRVVTTCEHETIPILK